MANATWPAGLPAYVDQDGYKETMPDTNIESQMDAGPPKSRRRTTINWRPFTMQMRLTRTQYGLFNTFYEATLAGGTLKFDWVHPYTRVAATFRFRKPPPSFSPRGDDMVAMFQVDLIP